MFVLDSTTDEPGIGTLVGGTGIFVDFTKEEKPQELEGVSEAGADPVWLRVCMER